MREATDNWPQRVFGSAAATAAPRRLVGPPAALRSYLCSVPLTTFHLAVAAAGAPSTPVPSPGSAKTTHTHTDTHTLAF